MSDILEPSFFVFIVYTVDFCSSTLPRFIYKFHLSNEIKSVTVMYWWSAYIVEMKSASSAYIQYRKSTVSGLPNSCQYSLSAASRYIMNSMDDRASLRGVPMIDIVVGPFIPATTRMLNFVSERRYLIM